MKVLGIDTSARTCSVALFQDDACLFSHLIGEGLTHSQTLLPLIQKALLETALSVSDLDLIAITSGPGSFTGLRIGISTVKGLAFSGQVPCVGVSTLEAMAMNALDIPDCVVCSLMDARRGEFYQAFFEIKNGTVTRLTEDRAVPGDLIAKEMKAYKNVLLIGDGAEKFSQDYPEFSESLAAPEFRYQCGVGAALLGMKCYKQGIFTNANQLAPVYLRLPQAEREFQAKNKDK